MQGPLYIKFTIEVIRNYIWRDISINLIRYDIYSLPFLHTFLHIKM